MSAKNRIRDQTCFPARRGVRAGHQADQKTGGENEPDGDMKEIARGVRNWNFGVTRLE
jgi:hypothetical protein